MVGTKGLIKRGKQATTVKYELSVPNNCPMQCSRQRPPVIPSILTDKKSSPTVENNGKKFMLFTIFILVLIVVVVVPEKQKERKTFAEPSIMKVAALLALAIYAIWKALFSFGCRVSAARQESTSTINLAEQLGKLCDGEEFVGLRIPDASTMTRQAIDMVLLTKRELFVMAIRNFEGILDLGTDGFWCLTDSKGQLKKIPDPVEMTKYQAVVLGNYIERRGLKLPAGFLKCRVVFTNPNCRLSQSVTSYPEVVPCDRMADLSEKSNNFIGRWAKLLLSGMEHDMLKNFSKELRFILSTSPSWDRLKLKDNYQLFGEFMGFRGKPQDMDNLKYVKRSKVAKISTYRTSVFEDFWPFSEACIRWIGRDYRQGFNEPEIQEQRVRADTELVFQPFHSGRPEHIKIKNLVSLSLSP